MSKNTELLGDVLGEGEGKANGDGAEATKDSSTEAAEKLAKETEKLNVESEENKV